VETRPWLGLAELIVRDNGRPPGDATDYLGGVADVLQAKKDHVMIDLGHLGELRDVALYVTDRQINRVGYSQEAAERTSTEACMIRAWPHAPAPVVSTALAKSAGGAPTRSRA
jgi:hypothetical protein